MIKESVEDSKDKISKIESDVTNIKTSAESTQSNILEEVNRIASNLNKLFISNATDEEFVVALISKASGIGNPSVRFIKWFHRANDGDAYRRNVLVRVDPDTFQKALAGKHDLKENPKFKQKYINRCLTKLQQEDRCSKRMNKTKSVDPLDANISSA